MVNLTDLPPVCGRLSSCPTSPGSCAGVLQATGEKILSLKLLTNAKNYGEQVSRNTSLWVMSPLHPDPLVLLPPQEILDTLCLNDCSGSGQCSKGVCLCAAGRTGADCGVSVAEVTIPSQPLFDETKLSQFVPSQGPRVASLENHGLCDVRVRPCRSNGQNLQKLLLDSLFHKELRDICFAPLANSLV